MRARARGAARGPPAVSPELGVALLMESSRDAKGRGPCHARATTSSFSGRRLWEGAVRSLPSFEKPTLYNDCDDSTGSKFKPQSRSGFQVVFNGLVFLRRLRDEVL